MGRRDANEVHGGSVEQVREGGWELIGVYTRLKGDTGVKEGGRERETG